MPELCAKSVKILHSFIQPGSDVLIPPEVIHGARGIAILRIVRAGLHFNGRGGKGIVLARLPDGSWSAPSALVVGGLGAGLTIGADVTHTVLILNTDASVRGFTEDAFSLGGNLAVSVGPVGRAVEATASLNNPPIFSYSQTKGFYFGVSVEGTVIKPSNDTNIGFYGPISAGEILSGAVPRPQAAAMFILESPFVIASRNSGSPDSSNNNEKKTESNQTMNRVYAQTPLTPPMDPTIVPPTYAASVDSSSSTTTAERALPTLPNNAVVDGTTFCVALYDYKSEEQGDLEFRAGDTIRVIQRKADGWWLGELEKRSGYFPSNFVRQV
ncbi:UNVERIFIED_CONTAM: SH3 domain-containing YSC84-like protein 1 [Siphonaria sp. JEL0065]|nr:SH3 domain-containing YSC84-like protein 1 [Siphonaria sp. JEL0065]